MLFYCLYYTKIYLYHNYIELLCTAEQDHKAPASPAGPSRSCRGQLGGAVGSSPRGARGPASTRGQPARSHRTGMHLTLCLVCVQKAKHNCGAECVSIICTGVNPCKQASSLTCLTWHAASQHSAILPSCVHQSNLEGCLHRCCNTQRRHGLEVFSSN